MSYETSRSSGSILLPALVVALGVSAFMALIGETPEDRVHDVQVHNAQIEAALKTMPNIHGVTDLILKDGGDETFTFHTRDAHGTGEDCTGNYEVENDIAKIVGDLTCTQTVAVNN